MGKMRILVRPKSPKHTKSTIAYNDQSCAVWFESFSLGTRANIVTRSVFHLPKKPQKFRLGCEWNTTFRFVPLEIFRNKRNFWKGSPIFPVENSQMEICVAFADFSSLSPVPYLSRSFKRPGLPQMELVTIGTRSSRTEIPNTNYPNFFVNGKRPRSSWLI